MDRLEKIYQLATELRVQIALAISEGLYYYPHHNWSRDEKVLKRITEWAFNGISSPPKNTQEKPQVLDSK